LRFSLVKHLTEHPMMFHDAVVFEEQTYLRGNMHRDDRKFSVEMQPWSAMSDNIISKDVCTATQLEVYQQRYMRGPLSQTQIEKRRVDLQQKLAGKYAANPRFFEEVYPELEKEEALAEARARKVMEDMCKARQHDEAAELGAKFVVWPVLGTHQWPMPSTSWTKHCTWFAKCRGVRRARQAQSKKWAQLYRAAQKKSQKVAPDSSWLRFVRKLSNCTSSASSCHSSESWRSSESDWEDLSNCCSDSSWQVDLDHVDDFECDDMNLWDLVPEVCLGPEDRQPQVKELYLQVDVEEVADRITNGIITKLSLSLGETGKLGFA